MKAGLKQAVRSFYLKLGRATGIRSVVGDALSRANSCQTADVARIVEESVVRNLDQLHELLSAPLNELTQITRNQFERAQAQANEHVARLESKQRELQQSLDSVREISQQRLDGMARQIQELSRQHQEAFELSLFRFAGLYGRLNPVPAPDPKRRTLDQCFAELQQRAPAAFAIWHELLWVNESVYAGFPPHSCSTNKQAMSLVFRRFLHKYLYGSVLDIGCGPQPVPSYLDGYPSELVAGIDPLVPPTPHPFAFAQTVAEFIPWPDKTFDVIVIGTSLDHVLLLDVGLREMRRVLKDNGNLVIWTSFVPEARAYDPYRPDITKVDDYHLFHFTRESFETTLQEQYHLVECQFSIDGGCSSFYCFRPGAD